MAGKFMGRDGMVDTRKGMEAVNSQQRRAGTRFAVSTIPCGCPDPGCGAFHRIETARLLPSAEEAVATMKAKKKRKKNLPAAESSK